MSETNTRGKRVWTEGSRVGGGGSNVTSMERIASAMYEVARAIKTDGVERPAWNKLTMDDRYPFITLVVNMRANPKVEAGVDKNDVEQRVAWALLHALTD